MKKNARIWRDALRDFPPFDKDVMGYYEIPETDGKKRPTGKMFRYYVICRVKCVTEGSGYRQAEWVDNDYNAVSPKFWTDLPAPPSQYEKKNPDGEPQTS